MNEDPPTHVVWVCELCLDGAGGVCNVPGCIFCRYRAPPEGAGPMWREMTHVEPEPNPLIVRALWSAAASRLLDRASDVLSEAREMLGVFEGNGGHDGLGGKGYLATLDHIDRLRRDIHVELLGETGGGGGSS